MLYDPKPEVKVHDSFDKKNDCAIRKQSMDGDCATITEYQWWHKNSELRTEIKSTGNSSASNMKTRTAWRMGM